MPAPKSELTATSSGRVGLVIVGLAAARAAVLADASARHGAVALLDDESGNGCRALTAASSAQLARALVPVRILVGGWVLITGMLAVAPVARSATAWGKQVAIAGALGAVALTGAVQPLIGTDVLSALMPLVLLWLIVGLAAANLVVLAVIRRRRGLHAGCRCTRVGREWLESPRDRPRHRDGALPLALVSSGHLSPAEEDK